MPFEYESTAVTFLNFHKGRTIKDQGFKIQSEFKSNIGDHF